MTVDGEELPLPNLPPTQVDMDLVVDEVTPEGNIRYTFTFVDAKAVGEGTDPQVAGAIDTAMAELVGVSGTAEVTARGETVATDLDTSMIDDPTISAQLDSLVGQIQSMSVPFPEEAVGVGGSWRSVNVSPIAGFTMIVVSTYTVTELTEDGYTLELTQEQNVEPGPIQIPTLPADAEATVLSSNITGSGVVGGSRTRFAPTASTRAAGDIVFSVTIAGTEREVLEQLDIQVDVAPL